MGIEPTQDGSTAPQTVLKTAPVTRPEAAPQTMTLCEAGDDVNGTLPRTGDGLQESIR
jgi:hypothetical protein